MVDKERLVERLNELGELLDSDEQSNRYLARQELAAKLPEILEALTPPEGDTVSEGVVEQLIVAVHALIVATDGMEALRPQRQAALDAMERAAIAALQSRVSPQACRFCGQIEQAHEPSGCCGDGGGSTFGSRVSGMREALIEATFARLNWQKYNTEQGDEIVYQAEKMAAAIEKLEALFKAPVPMSEDVK